MGRAMQADKHLRRLGPRAIKSGYQARRLLLAGVAQGIGDSVRQRGQFSISLKSPSLAVG